MRNKGQIYLDSWDIKILKLIMKNPGASVGEIFKEVQPPLSSANFSVHLNRLEVVGFIIKEQDTQFHSRLNLKVNEELLSKQIGFLLERLPILFLKNDLRKKINKTKVSSDAISSITEEKKSIKPTEKARFK